MPKESAKKKAFTLSPEIIIEGDSKHQNTCSEDASPTRYATSHRETKTVMRDTVTKLGLYLKKTEKKLAKT